jgi:hypothetical protein
MSQKSFAKLVGIPFETIRSIEGGRRSKGESQHKGELSEEASAKIKDATAAAWNAKESLWEYAFKSENSKALIPFNRAIYTEYRRCLETPPSSDFKGMSKNAALLKLKLLLDYATDSQWYPLMFKIHKAISDWRTELGITGQLHPPHGGPLIDLERFLDDSRPAFVISFDKHTGKITQFIPISSSMAKALPPHMVLNPSKKKTTKPTTK